MARRRHTPEQVVRKLRGGELLLGEAKTSGRCAGIWRSVSKTWHRSRNQYGGSKAEDTKRLRDLERENHRLKRLVAQQALDIDMLEEISRGNLVSADRRRHAVVVLVERLGSPSGVPAGWLASTDLAGRHQSVR